MKRMQIRRAFLFLGTAASLCMLVYLRIFYLAHQNLPIQDLNFPLPLKRDNVKNAAGKNNRAQPALKATTYICPKSLSQKHDKIEFDSSRKLGPTFLWGIPTYDSEKEAERRQTIRETYLSFFAQSDTPKRICSLSELTCDETLQSKCQIVYSFFMGANPAAPPLRLDAVDDFRSMITEEVISAGVENDTVYLNIRENQFDGKMPTWFHFGSLVASEFPFIQYVAKVSWSAGLCSWFEMVNSKTCSRAV